ncbi:MAG: HD domain-containing protein [Phycisphaerae bacterium]|nr:HD domain-containing protein [Phycisphaerae bacterium]
MPNKRIFVSDISNGMTVDQVFVVRSKELRTTKAGGLFISFELGDSSGGIPAKLWQASEAVFNGIEAEGFLQVKGRVEDYRGTLQLSIDSCRPYPKDKVNMSEFLPVSPYDIEEMWTETLEILHKIKNKHIKRLIKKFLEDQKLVAAIKRAPAAMQMHQNYIGGLLEHTLNVMRGADRLLTMYPLLNADLVLASAFLHDLGKAAELTSGLTIHYTDRGALVGHIVVAAMWVQQKAAAVSDELGEPFPRRIVDLLQHIILAHHGQYDFGSPKLPAVPEAFFIHYLDNLDAKMFMTATAIENDTNHDSHFTSYIRSLETRLYKHSDNLDGDDESSGADDASGSLFG